MHTPAVIITGATGFLGGQLVRQLRKEYRIFALGRRSPRETGGPEGPGIHWYRVDIADRERLAEVFRHVADSGGARQLLHMAAYYDFTGEDSPEYLRTNVGGTRNLLELSEPLGLRKFIFASSVAACPFPGPGEVISEATPPDAPFPYARSKKAGEEMLIAYRDRVPSCIVRIAAIFSDWCEYEPLEEFLRTWCSRRWNSRLLGGRGASAVPYLHVDDLLSFFLRVVEKGDALDPAEVLIASHDGATTHAELFREATRAFQGSPRHPLYAPPGLAAIGIRAREWWGRRTGKMPFERSWMVPYIDRQLRVTSGTTCRRLDWVPDPQLHVLARLPTLVRNMTEHPDDWKLRSRRKRARTGTSGGPPAGRRAPP